MKKAQSKKLGSKDPLLKNKFDQNVERIKELMGYGLSVRKIAMKASIKTLPSHTLNMNVE